ncbi:hypothetical protein TeGR_g12037, partial [Tetraparma gracilis]
IVHNVCIACIGVIYFLLLIKEAARRVDGYGEARLAHALAHKIVKSVKERAGEAVASRRGTEVGEEDEGGQVIIDGDDEVYSDDESVIDKELVRQQFIGKDGEMVKAVVEMKWSEVSWSVWIRFFPTWLPLTFVGVLITTEYSVSLALTKNYHIPTTTSEKVSCGLSCILLWLTTMQ